METRVALISIIAVSYTHLEAIQARRTSRDFLKWLTEEHFS